MVIKKRCLLWDWTNTQGCHAQMDKIHFDGPLKSVSNWNTWTPPELKDRVPFRPMIRGLSNLSEDEWRNIEKNKDGIIHYFNEPERAGISVEQAADIWSKKVLPLRRDKGNKLVNPSCANDAHGEAWIAEFMKGVQNDPPDFLGIHYYGTDHDEAIKYIKGMHVSHPEHPVFVTEIASISRDYDEVLIFTVEVANWMDATDWIEEYAFFGCMRQCADSFVSPEAQLMKSNGEYTDLMFKLMYDQPMHT